MKPILHAIAVVCRGIAGPLQLARAQDVSAYLGFAEAPHDGSSKPRLRHLQRRHSAAPNPANAWAYGAGGNERVLRRTMGDWSGDIPQTDSGRLRRAELQPLFFRHRCRFQAESENIEGIRTGIPARHRSGAPALFVLTIRPPAVRSRDDLYPRISRRARQPRGRLYISNHDVLSARSGHSLCERLFRVPIQLGARVFDRHRLLAGPISAAIVHDRYRPRCVSGYRASPPSIAGAGRLIESAPGRRPPNRRGAGKCGRAFERETDWRVPR